MVLRVVVNVVNLKAVVNVVNLKIVVHYGPIPLGSHLRGAY